jgi:hypothetical protein
MERTTVQKLNLHQGSSAKTIDHLKDKEQETYNKFMNELGVNSNDKKGKLKQVKQN